MRKRICILLIFVVCLTACSKTNPKKQYSDFVSEFYKLYYSVAADVDIEHSLDTVKKLQSEQNKEAIKEMGDLIDNIKSSVPNNKIDHYNK